MNILKRHVLCVLLIILIIIPANSFAQFSIFRYNHPELEWKTFETKHFSVHYHEGAEWTAQQSAEIAESIYEPVTSYYDFQPDKKTDLVIKDTDDVSNGAAYYYDNKIEIWASPLNFLLRGNHSWLRDVITHEFSHIVSLQKGMKFSRNIPGFYFQAIGYEKEKRDDVIYGYPSIIASYPMPGLVIPMWLAEGIAQNMYPGCGNDLWDTHRDMLMRDRALYDNILSLNQMGSFGKRGIGNETVYNQGYAFVRYLNKRFGDNICPDLMDRISTPLQISISNALKKETGISGYKIHEEWKKQITDNYNELTKTIRENSVIGDILEKGATTQIYPQWSGDSLLYFLSNKGMDSFYYTSLYVYNTKTQKSELIKENVRSRVSPSPDGKYIYYSRKSLPNKVGSIFYDIYRLNLVDKEEEQITFFRRAINPILSPCGEKIVFVTIKDGNSNLVIRNLDEEGKETVITDFSNGEQLFAANFSPDGKKIVFDYSINHGRDIFVYEIESEKISLLVNGDYDSRNPFYSPDGKWLYYSSDQTGIFNIYRKSLDNSETQLLTNVLGGAFMPTVNEQGVLCFSLFNESEYRISVLENPKPLDISLSRYKPEYKENIPEMSYVASLNNLEETKYKDRFSKYFLMPKLMLDYGTVKPGLYFFSNEIIDRFNVFGAIAGNIQGDKDLAMLVEYHQWTPTFYFEIYSMSRSKFGIQDTISSYPIEFDYTFHLIQSVLGASLPSKGFNKFRFDMILSKFRTATDERIPEEGIYQNGFTYDYYKGINFKLDWIFKKIMYSVNQETNPNNGMQITTSIYRNYDRFIEGFDVNGSYGTLETQFSKNYYWKLEQEGVVHHKIPVISDLIGNFKWKAGWISNRNIDSFFNFFGGGLPGLRGYPFYSIEGRNLLSFHYTLRYPIFLEKDIQIGPFNLQNSILGLFVESGNAFDDIQGYPDLKWDEFKSSPIDVISNIGKDFKSDVGIELKFSGFSFYAYPTAISFDCVYGLDKFKIEDNQYQQLEYGREWRTYLTILFGL